MGEVVASGYNKESGPAGERAAAPKVANYAQELPRAFGGARYRYHNEAFLKC